MRQAFDNILKKLKQDELCLIAVTDNQNYTKLLVATSGKDIAAKYGSIENMFETFVSKGITNIGIQEYRKSGSGTKRMGAPIHFNLSQKENKVVDSVVSYPSTPAMPFGLAGGLGLGFADIMALNTNSVLKDRLEVENDFLKRENISLKTQVDELKEEKLENKYNTEGKKSQNEFFLGALQTLGPALAGFITKSPASLNGAQPSQPQLSDIKMQMLQVLYDPNFSDEMTGVLFNVIHKINNDEAFYPELEALLQPQK